MGYRVSNRAAADSSAEALTSKGTYLASEPAAAKASNNTTVLSDEPEPNSITVSAPDSSTMSPAASCSARRSASVG